ncbi:MAG: methyltransferase domain-containing protein [Pseudomonadota bacterium]
MKYDPEGRDVSIPQIFDRKLVAHRRNRSTQSDCARDAGFLLDRAVDDICERLSIVTRDFENALIIGAHDGRVGRALRAARPRLATLQVDHAHALLAHADEPKLVADEEALPFAPDTFDLVIAPLTLQYCNDLPGVLAQIQSCLKPDGLLLGALMGGQTLVELSDAMLSAEAEMTDTAVMRVMPRIEVRQLGQLLQRAGFTLPVTDSDVVDVTYQTPLHAMREIKAMGGSNMLAARPPRPMTRGLLMRACEIYSDRYRTSDGRIRATFEILTITGWAPHPDQPKPLKPGSATHRLADALGVDETALSDRKTEDER